MSNRKTPPPVEALKFTGWFIPAFIVDHFRSGKINATETLLLSLIECLYAEDGWCHQSNAFMAEFIGVTDRHVSLMLSNLEEKKLIHRKMSSDLRERKIKLT